MRYVIALSAIGQPVGEAHVDLVLRRPDLVVRVLDVDAELLQRQHRVAAQVGGGVERREVEVAALVEHLRRPAVQLGLPEVEELQLGADEVVVEAHRLRPLERAPHDVARVALVGLAAGHQHVAEHPRDGLLLRPPRQHRERARVRHRDHVRLLDPVEAGDRRAVEAHALLERPLQLVLADGEALQLAEDVREPEPDELDVVLLDQRQHVRLGRRRSKSSCSVVAIGLLPSCRIVCLTCSGARRCGAPPGPISVVSPSVAVRCA